jgi:nucleosome binding factor SPN SPT16 subunit
VYKLPDLWMRPAFPGKGRKVPGALEAHSNGFRYSTPKGEVLDVMYRNIKHALFQPAENEMITILHCHLHHPIMVGNKKTKDVQFYTEVRRAVSTGETDAHTSGAAPPPCRAAPCHGTHARARL